MTTTLGVTDIFVEMRLLEVSIFLGKIYFIQTSSEKNTALNTNAFIKGLQ